MAHTPVYERSCVFLLSTMAHTRVYERSSWSSKPNSLWRSLLFRNISARSSIWNLCQFLWIYSKDYVVKCFGDYLLLLYKYTHKYKCLIVCLLVSRGKTIYIDKEFSCLYFIFFHYLIQFTYIYHFYDVIITWTLLFRNNILKWLGFIICI